MKARLLITGALAILALVGASAALAASPDDRALPRGVSPYQAAQSAGTLPDDRALPRGTTLSVVEPSSSPDDRPFARSIPAPSQPTFVRVSSESFDWTDAGIGAASGFGIALVLIGAGLVLVRRGADRGRPATA